MIKGTDKKLGFGCMRLPMQGDKVDDATFKEMIDTYLAAGFNYFDTAQVYIGGQSETALRECLVKRYPRESFTITDKLSASCFKREKDIRPFFEDQLEKCGVTYFDYYLHHALSAQNYGQFVKAKAFETVKALKAAGKIKHIGLSFHDKADVLDQILSEQPEIEIVQIQLNYADYDNPTIESYKCYQVCQKYQKPILVMEPVKGGKLVNIPDKAKQVFDALDQDLSYASYAIRYAASFPEVMMVLSGMSNLEQMTDNLSYMTDFKPLTKVENDAIVQVRQILKADSSIACTNCRYCVDGCPKKILIPDLFETYNRKLQFQDKSTFEKYADLTANKGLASACIACGRCEKICPQQLPIIKYLEDIAEVFETV
ncbi:aldo/keto reductase [Pseudolactococcus yaeyamensis]